MVNSLLEVRGIHKYYGKQHCLKDISFRVNPGEICGLVGENGAGKTTLIRIILGLSKAHSGEIIGRNREGLTKQEIGFVVGAPFLYLDLTVRDNLEIYRRVAGHSQQEKEDAIKRLSLESFLKKKGRHLSTGMRQRTGLAMAVMGDPDLLILDEPLNGVDPSTVLEFRKLLLKIAEKKKTGILISSHILGELDKLVDTCCFIRAGELHQISVAHQSLEELWAQEMSGGL